MRTKEKIRRWLPLNRWQLNPEKYKNWAEKLQPRTRVKRIKELEEEINLLEKEIEKLIASEQELRSKLSALKEAESEYNERLEEQAFVKRIRNEVITNPTGFVFEALGPEEGLRVLKEWKHAFRSEYTLGAEDDCRRLFTYACDKYNGRSWVTRFTHVIREPEILWRLIVASKEYKDL